MLIVNADDWGRDRDTTERILECVQCGAVSSVSAMVFMEDSERAAAIAREKGIDTGLHLNLTTPFSSANTSARLVECQQRISAYLQGNPFARGVFHPGLARTFKYVVEAEREEYARLYGAPPDRIDGHHHMHLCSNVLLGGLLPSGTLVRRHFSYEPREKALRNLVFRKFTDVMLARRHRVADRFFSLPPLEPLSRLQAIFSLARQFVVEVETHPVNPEEYRFLAGGEILRWAGDCRIAPRYVVP
jgi:predicted glycoside hydrolase/deacetylase ChbG (UPF0249 family)